MGMSRVVCFTYKCTSINFFRGLNSRIFARFQCGYLGILYHRPADNVYSQGFGMLGLDSLHDLPFRLWVVLRFMCLSNLIWTSVPPPAVWIPLRLTASSKFEIVQRNLADLSWSTAFYWSVWNERPIPVATPSKVWVYGRSLAGIVGSNPAGAWMFFVSYVLSGRGLCCGVITLPEESFRVWCV
jgi:hypothetical protein